VAPRLPATAAWRPADYEDADIYAIRALAAGNANESQQKRALDWIINKAAMTYDQPFRPGGLEGARETDFAAGRMFVGQQVVKLTKIVPATPARP
jgi:hypothetical protein